MVANLKNFMVSIFAVTARLSRSARQLFAIFVGCSVLGCGGADGFLTISGSVTYDGQPVTSGTIGFVTQNATPAKRVGTRIIDGRYEILRQDGLEAGSYQVLIYAERPSGRQVQADEGSSEMVQQMVQYIPDIYNARTTLAAEISGERDDLNFELAKPKPTKKSRR